MKTLSTLLALFLCVWLQGTRAAAEENPPDEPPYIDSPSNHFMPVIDPGLIRGLIEFPVYSFYLGAPRINGVAYVPNFSPRLGLHTSWKEYGLTFSIALPLPKEEIERRGNSDQFNLVLNRYWRRYGLDLYYQSYRGFYVASPFTELNVQKPSRYPQLPDAHVINSGFNWYQVLHPERYSLSASFAQNEIQLVSGGSWLLTGFFNHLQMKSGEAFIAGSDPNSMQTRPELQSGTFQTVGAGGGYGHTWIKEKAFLTVQGISGAGAQIQQIDELNGQRENRISLAFKLNANAAIGYTKQSYVIGGKVLADALVSNVKNTQIFSTLVNGQVFFGARF